MYRNQFVCPNSKFGALLLQIFQNVNFCRDLFLPLPAMYSEGWPVCVVLYSEAMGQDILEYFFKEDEDRWRRFAAMEPLLDETGSLGEPESSVVSATTSVVANGAAAVDDEEEDESERKDGDKEKAEEDDAMVKRFE